MRGGIARERRAYDVTAAATAPGAAERDNGLARLLLLTERYRDKEWPSWA